MTIRISVEPDDVRGCEGRFIVAMRHNNGEIIGVPLRNADKETARVVQWAVRHAVKYTLGHAAQVAASAIRDVYVVEVER